MARHIKVITQMIKSMDLVNTLMFKGKCSKGIGRMECVMEMELLQIRLDKFLRADGLMECFLDVRR